MKNKLNSQKAWNNLIYKNRQSIRKSNIYKDKNNKIYKYLRKHKGNLLDCGVGYGYIEQLLETNKNIKIYGIDISSEAVKYLNSFCKGIFCIGNICRMPFKRNMFNCVLALDIFEHLSASEITKAYGEINRVLKKRGLLIVSVPLNESSKNKKSNLHLRKYCYKNLSDELHKNGYIIKKYEYLFAFNKLYFLKTLFVKIFKPKRIEPNLLIVYAQKN